MDSQFLSQIVATMMSDANPKPGNSICNFRVNNNVKRDSDEVLLIGNGTTDDDSDFSPKPRYIIIIFIIIQ